MLLGLLVSGDAMMLNDSFSQRLTQAGCRGSAMQCRARELVHTATTLVNYSTHKHIFTKDEPDQELQGLAYASWRGRGRH